MDINVYRKQLLSDIHIHYNSIILNNRSDYPNFIANFEREIDFKSYFPKALSLGG